LEFLRGKSQIFLCFFTWFRERPRVILKKFYS
jgi:hypothetical protein